MMSLVYDCSECGRPDSADVDLPRARDELCYRCYVKGIRFAFRGAQGGRESFHEDTIAETQRKIVQGAAEQGRTVRPKNKVNGAFM